MTRSVVPLLCCLAACTPGEDREGTAVGNPGALGVGIDGIPEEVSLARADASVDHVVLQRCDGPVTDVAVEATFDALEPDTHGIPLPGGTWCSLTLWLASPDGLRLGGTTTGGTTFDLSLDVGVVVLYGPFDVDDTELLAAVPLDEVLDVATLEALGTDVVLPADDELARDWAQAAAEGTELWDDVDADGAISAADAQIAWSEPDYPSADLQDAGAGCSCAASPMRSSGWIALAPGLLLFFQRRRGRCYVGRGAPRSLVAGTQAERL